MAKKSVTAATTQPESTVAVDDASMPDFTPLLTKEQMATVEKTAHDFGINRRVALATLTRSRAQLMAGGGASPENVGKTLLAMIDSVENFRDHLKDLQEVAETAWARLMVAAETLADLEAQP